MRLLRGRGTPTTGACWMSAISYYAGYDWSDHPPCVDILIRNLCIVANDGISDFNRERVIGPHLLTPVGTNQGHDLTRKRRDHVLTWCKELLERRCKGLLEYKADPRDLDDATFSLSFRYQQIVEAVCLMEPPDGPLLFTADSASFATIQLVAALVHADPLPDNFVECEVVPTILDLCAMGERCEVTQARALAELPQ